MQVYRVSDPLESLRLRVRLRKLHGDPVNSEKSKARAAKAAASSSRRLSSRWGAEKQPKHDQQDTVDESANLFPGDEVSVELRWQEKLLGPKEISLFSSQRYLRRKRKFELSRTELDYARQLEEMVQVGEDPLGGIREAMIFSYTEKDGYAPRTPNSRSTNPGTPLAEAVENLHRKGKGSGRIWNSDSLSSEAATVQSRLLREDRIKVFYVMAAVDVDVNSCRNHKPRVHEQVLLTIRAHQGRGLEVIPGFSEEEPESDDEGGFPSDHSIAVADTFGPRLRSSWFVTPSGSIYEYTVENLGSLCSVEDAEAAAAEERNRNRRLVEERAAAAGGTLLGAPPQGYAVTHHVYMELISAVGFDAEKLSAEYELTLPTGFRHVTESFSNTHLDGEKSSAAMVRGVVGATQLVRARSQPVASVKELLLNPPFQEALRATAVSKIASVLLIILLIATLVLGLQWIFWFILAVVLIVADTLTVNLYRYHEGVGLSAVQQVQTAHFGLLAEFHMLQSNASCEAGGAYSPHLYFQVLSAHSFGRQRIQGYGHVSMPTQPGIYDLTVRVWRPTISIRSEMQDFFAGGANHLKSIRGVVPPQNTRAMRYGFRTKSSRGGLRIRLHVVSQQRPPELAEKGAEPPVLQGSSIHKAEAQKRSIEEILKSVRQNKSRLSLSLPAQSAASGMAAERLLMGATAPGGRPVAPLQQNPSEARLDPNEVLRRIKEQLSEQRK